MKIEKRVSLKVEDVPGISYIELNSGRVSIADAMSGVDVTFDQDQLSGVIEALQAIQRETGQESAAPDREPRRWNRWADIPTDVQVVDKDGDVWTWDDGEECWRIPVLSSDLDIRDVYGPFTEILRRSAA